MNYMKYKDYIGSVDFSEEDGVFHGKVIGPKDFISFEGDSVKALTDDFHNAIDEYLEFCKTKGKTPELSFKGSLNVRIGPQLHREAALYASEHHQTLNSFITEAIETRLQNYSQRYITK